MFSVSQLRPTMVPLERSMGETPSRVRNAHRRAVSCKNASKNTVLPHMFQQFCLFFDAKHLDFGKFCAAYGRQTKILPKNGDFWPFRIWRLREVDGGDPLKRRSGEVVFLPLKSGNYHLSVSQPPARSVCWEPHTGKCSAPLRCVCTRLYAR